ncbi:MAG UNVERIFIED_CONTAM: CDGSH iron-sulfur domain-containing protein [Planctomycetaceae bacterium]|jgi:CDGSH-type Zn-finger protein
MDRFLVTGPAVVTDAAGNVFDLKGKETFALCRCGVSANRPFCDGARQDLRIPVCRTCTRQGIVKPVRPVSVST